ncbi:MAG: polymer-forming cytoskeletal protein [Chloroflexota bacterium]|nr:MAG: polymer-forming cytoskeletal protein [Chloroflexota bacterium]
MFRRTSDTQPLSDLPASTDRVTSVIGPGVVWKGQLSGKGGVRIEGALDGDIQLQGLLVVGETGRINCQELRANVVIVAGAVRGDIVAEKLEIRSTGRVWGNVVTAAFSTEEGAFLRGQVTMEEHVEITARVEPEAEDAEQATD